MTREQYTVGEAVALMIKYHVVYADPVQRKVYPYSDGFCSANIENISESDLASALLLIEEFKQNVTITLLTMGSIGNFVDSLYKIVTTQDTITNPQLNILRYLPKVVYEFRSKAEINSLCFKSQYVGTVGEKLALSLRIMSCRRVVHDMGDFIAVNAIDEAGNVYSFSVKKEIPVSESYSYVCTAKVKKHFTDRYLQNNLVTALNYVKEAK